MMVRKDFPIFNIKVRGKPLVYLDSAATTQKPQVVMDTLNKYYSSQNSNVHRGVHYLSELATKEYEAAREKVQKFIHAKDSREIIFTRGTTESINLVAQTFGRERVQEGDEVLITHMEHHSNIVPWQILCSEKKAHLKIAPINQKGELLIDEFKKLVNPKTKIVGIAHVSNALGTINPIKEIVSFCHDHGVPVLVDGAQAASHLKVDVEALDCDFYTLSGHKIYGPTGIGVLYGKLKHLEKMPPYQGGGDMIKSVTFEKTIYNDVPFKFEAGTPNIAGAIGLGSALDYLSALNMEKVQKYEEELLKYMEEQLLTLPKIKLIGRAEKKAALQSFIVENIHPHDVGTILDQEGVAVRTGHHCAQPVMNFYGVPATVRASLGIYNTKEDISLLVLALKKVFEVLG
ncbi:MAG: cysteine desulfurase [Deltaproteobacteria bacterium]|nr:cysteine desulfurase [Deltaproteobacteria bacterium]